MVIDGCPYKENQKERAWETGLSTTASQISTIGINRNITQSDTNVISVTDSVNNNSADLKLDLAIVGTDIILTAENGDSTQQATTKINIDNISGINPPNFNCILRCSSNSVITMITGYESGGDGSQAYTSQFTTQVTNVNNIFRNGVNDWVNVFTKKTDSSSANEIFYSGKYYSASSSSYIFYAYNKNYEELTSGFIKLKNVILNDSSYNGDIYEGDLIIRLPNKAIKLKDNVNVTGNTSIIATVNSFAEYYETEPTW